MSVRMLTAGLFAILAVCAFLIVYVTLKPTEPVAFDPHPPFYPGEPVKGVSCRWERVSSGVIDCFNDDGLYTERSLRDNSAISVSMMIEPVQLGQIMLSWGAPTGNKRSGRFCRLYWGIRSALLPCSSLSPTAKISMVRWGETPETVRHWRGFARVSKD